MSKDNALPELQIVVLEGSPYGTPTTRVFASAEEAMPHIVERVRATVQPALKERLEKALSDRIVSEDGHSAVSEVLAGKLAFLRALAKAYGTNISIATQTLHDDEDECGCGHKH